MTVTDSAPDLSGLRIDRSPRPPAARRVLWRALLVAVPVALAVVGFVLLRQRAAAVEVRIARAEVRGGLSGEPGGVTANGYVVAQTKASVASKIAGRLEFLGVTEGSVVRRGQVIARLEHADYAAALAESEANLSRARAALHEARADGADAHVSGLTAVITPYDREPAKRTVCTADLTVLPRPVALRIDVPGEAVIQVKGRSLEDSDVVIEARLRVRSGSG
jgi:hypothetical protein